MTIILLRLMTGVLLLTLSSVTHAQVIHSHTLIALKVEQSQLHHAQVAFKSQRRVRRERRQRRNESRSQRASDDDGSALLIPAAIFGAIAIGVSKQRRQQRRERQRTEQHQQRRMERRERATHERRLSVREARAERQRNRTETGTVRGYITTTRD